MFHVKSLRKLKHVSANINGKVCYEIMICCFKQYDYSLIKTIIPIYLIRKRLHHCHLCYRIHLFEIGTRTNKLKLILFWFG